MTAARRELPVDLAEIAALVGRDAALKLALAAPGERVYIPKRDGRARALLIDAMGAAAAEAIIRHFAGETIYVPMARKELVPWLAAQGRSTREIAHTLGMAVATVSQYRAQPA